MESSVLDMNISNTFLLRPSLILGRKESRMGESLGKILLLVNPFLVHLKNISPQDQKPLLMQ